MDYPRGSEWSKWDLHVHTPLSLIQEYGGDTDEIWERFILSLENLPKDVKVIGINDYYFIDGYEKIMSFKNKGRLSNIERIFPLLEFRIDTFASATENKFSKINLHVIFDIDEKNLAAEIIKIKDEFIGNIHLSKSHSTEKLTKENLQNYSSDKKLKTGFAELIPSTEEIVELIKSKQWKEKVFTVLGYREWNDLEKSTQLKKQKKELYSLADAFFTASVNDNNEKKEEVLGFFSNGEPQKPLLHSGDIHEFSFLDTYSINKAGEKEESRNYKCLTWIKADPTFEGLKQIIYEPKERVKIQYRNPGDSKTERIVIDNLIYRDSSGAENTVFLNKDLNSIIGVRGSGKSTLLKNLAQKIDIIQFSQKDKKSPYPLDNFEVIWADGQKNDGTSESPKNIFYVPQNYLSSLAYDDGDYVKERDAFLTELLKKNTRFANAIQLFDNFVSKNKVKIEELIQKLLTADASIKEVEILLKKQGSKSEIDEEVKNKNGQIKKFKDATGSSITDSEINSYSEAQKAVSDSNKIVDILNQDKDILILLKKNGADIFISDQEFSLLSSARQELIREELNKKSKQDLEILIVDEIAKIEKQIQELNKIIKDNEIIAKNLEVQIKKTKALDDFTKELAILLDTQDKIQKLSEKLGNSKEDRTNTVDSISDAYNDFELQQDAVYKTIKFEEKFTFLKVEVIAKYNTLQIKNFVERNINTRDSDPSLKLEEDIKILFSDNPTKPSKETVKKIIIGLVDGRIKIKVEAGDKSTVISQLLLNRYEIDYLNSVKTQDGEICFKDMTGGQKAIALLELIFSFDDEKYPILIDQPEDDLDVGGVATDLVNFIKTEKQKRQIIVVSHNANLVICSDTEEIIMSSFSRISTGKYNFSYATGSIENTERREDIIRVLEGGRDALTKRARKLNLKYEI